MQSSKSRKHTRGACQHDFYRDHGLPSSSALSGASALLSPCAFLPSCVNTKHSHLEVSTSLSPIPMIFSMLLKLRRLVISFLGYIQCLNLSNILKYRIDSKPSRSHSEENALSTWYQVLSTRCAGTNYLPPYVSNTLLCRY